jgi:hypothetical protein
VRRFGVLNTVWFYVTAFAMMFLFIVGLFVLAGMWLVGRLSPDDEP